MSVGVRSIPAIFLGSHEAERRSIKAELSELPVPGSKAASYLHSKPNWLELLSDVHAFAPAPGACHLCSCFGIDSTQGGTQLYEELEGHRKGRG